MIINTLSGIMFMHLSINKKIEIHKACRHRYNNETLIHMSSNHCDVCKLHDVFVIDDRFYGLLLCIFIMTSSNGTIFRVTGPLCGEFLPVFGEFPAQRPVTRSFDVFFDLRVNKRLSKQSGGWWFETLSRSLWRHRNVNAILNDFFRWMNNLFRVKLNVHPGAWLQ